MKTYPKHAINWDDNKRHLKNIIFLDVFNKMHTTKEDLHLCHEIYEEDIIRQDFSILFWKKSQRVSHLKSHYKEIPYISGLVFIEEYAEIQADLYIATSCGSVQAMKQLVGFIQKEAAKNMEKP